MEKDTIIAKSGYQMIKRHKKNSNEILPSAILKRAIDFSKAFDRCISIENGDMLFIPAYTNLALSLELCLKAIIKNEQNSNPSEHDLSILFNLLSETTKHNIIQNFTSFFNEVFNSDISEESFYSNLKGIATTFYDYRYEYEWGTGKGFMINDYFFRCLRVALFDYAAETIN